ncbi:MAG: DUF1214 domain-containing protein [Hyphomicrobium sp.]
MALIILSLGVGSSWYFIKNGSRISTVSYGPWQTWRSAAEPDADPYTNAHFILTGALPLPADVGETYVATKDSDGKSLHSSCDYKIISSPQSFLLWSLAVFDSKGQVIKNPSDRYSFTNKTAALDEDGRFTAILSRSAKPGNWLPTAGAGYLTVVFMVMNTKQNSEIQPLDYLPKFEILNCR